MNSSNRIVSWSVRLAAAVLAGMPMAQLRADTPPPPAPPAVHGQENEDTEAQLEAARRRLEESTREVARLSEQMSGMVMAQVLPYVEAGHAIIGVQLDATADTHGARVQEVSPGGPAADAGMQPGDVIVAVNGASVAGAAPARQVSHLLREVKPDSQVHIRVLRGGLPRELVVTARPGPAVLAAAALTDLPKVLPDITGGYLFRRPLMDLELVTLTPRLGSYFGADRGVLVVRAPSEGALKLEDGDVILSIDGRTPTSGSHATRILSSYQSGEKIAIKVVRQHKTLELESIVPERETLERSGTLERERALVLPPALPRAAISGHEAA